MTTITMPLIFTGKAVSRCAAMFDGRRKNVLQDGPVRRKDVSV